MITESEDSTDPQKTVQVLTIILLFLPVRSADFLVRFLPQSYSVAIHTAVPLRFSTAQAGGGVGARRFISASSHAQARGRRLRGVISRKETGKLPR
jgi:hypothetical protein